MATNEADSATNLVDLLFGRYRQRALSLLLLAPDRRYHVRELARLTGTTAGTLHKELSKLAAAGLLLRQPEGRNVYYQANTDCPVFPELAGLFRKTVGLAGVLREALLPLADRLRFAFIFGSVARGEERSGSDVDVMLMGDVEFVEAVQALHPCQEQIQREINPVVYRPDEFLARAARRDPFIREVLDSPRLYLIGSDHDFGKFVTHP